MRDAERGTFTCDICGFLGGDTKREQIADQYATNEVRDLCGPCMAIVNAAYDRASVVAIEMKKSLVRRAIDVLKATVAKNRPADVSL